MGKFGEQYESSNFYTFDSFSESITFKEQEKDIKRTNLTLVTKNIQIASIRGRWGLLAPAPPPPLSPVTPELALITLEEGEEE